MKRTMRNLYWLTIGLILGLTILWLFVTPVSGASLGVGGGLISPHSHSGNDKLEKGLSFSVSLEDLYYENDKWGVNVGFLHVVSRYKKQDNHGAQKKRSVDSKIAALYVKPYYDLTEHIKPFLMTGIETNFADSTELGALFGGGIGYNIDEKWSLEGSYLYVWDPVKDYDLSTLMIRYEF